MNARLEDLKPDAQVRGLVGREAVNEVNVGRNSPHCFRLVLVTVDGERASSPVYVSGVDWGLPGFGDTQITKNLQRLLAAGRAPPHAAAG
jgi:hypothetical protein